MAWLTATLTATAVAAEEPAARRGRPFGGTTNADLERVHPFAAETGVRSLPAVEGDPTPAAEPEPATRGRGEAYWRREAAGVRERLRALEERADGLRVRIAERERAPSDETVYGSRKRSSAGSTSIASLQGSLAAVERRMQWTWEDFEERARRDGALPGWLRERRTSARGVVLCCRPMLEIPVELGARRYVISVGHGLARLLPDLLAPLRGRRTVVVASRRVFKSHGKALERSLRGLGRAAHLPRARRRALQEPSHARDRLRQLPGVTARPRRSGGRPGGGVVGDLAGFAAASWMRGVDWVVVPTTLLAMVDSSIGGKVAINHARAKNMIGAFHQPRAVVIDPAFLATLPEREFRSGAYEILKCAVLGDDALFASLRRAPAGLTGWDKPEVDNAIATACRIKADVVERDEREGSLRYVLNLGHTIGHALEAVTGYKRFTHGEAVGWGLVGASWIARHRGLLAPLDFDAIASAVDHIGPRPRVSDLAPARILEAVTHDKKARAGRVPFVLPTAIGRVVVKEARHARRDHAGAAGDGGAGGVAGLTGS